MNKIHRLAGLGQSIWLDYIRRAFIESGELQELINDGVSGVTSNPAIFAAAIAGSEDYDAALRDLGAAGLPAIHIYEALAVEDIQAAADALRPVFERTAGDDGYVSLEVSPELADDTESTVEEARRLYALVDRPNLMIKVPATPAGVAAIKTLIGEGINVNVTLMFSLAHYDAVAEAYISGLEQLVANGGDPSQVASVASFFLSRIDSAVDAKLAALGDELASTLAGKAAIANAKVTYERFRQTFKGSRWENLTRRGGRVQRVLWASTSTKDANYPDTMYVDELIGPDTVNTLPPATLAAFLDHGKPAVTVTDKLAEAEAQLAQLAGLGIDLDAITERLQREGVAKFARPFEALLETIAGKVAQLQQASSPFEAALGDYQPAVDKALFQIKEQEIMRRIWVHDHTVWAEDPNEVSNRLGWLHSPEIMSDSIERIQALLKSVREEGYTHALVLGMGGSSLAPDVFSKAFGHDHDGLTLHVLDSTDPGAVLHFADSLDPATTLFMVSTKSGGTVETLSFFKVFYNLTAERVGRKVAGDHFVAVTDRGSRLHKLADRHHFREIFLNDPNIGGRYAALSFFGLAPAGLAGIDLSLLLSRAQIMACNSESCNDVIDGDNLGGRLGAIMGVLAKAGRDKITLISSPGLANFGDWIEQLIAESTGKEGKGILPIVGEPVGSPEVYGDDRLFFYLRLDGDTTHDDAVAALESAGQPLVTLRLKDRYDMGGQFFLWEMATAVAGHILGIQPFDQPNVESAKVLARAMVTSYEQDGRLPAGDTKALSVEALATFLAQAQSGDYISLQAYIQPTPDSEAALRALQLELRDRTHLATTMGYGPRFLHSTGQLHKGDGGNGLFVQFVSEAKQDVAIPDEAGEMTSVISFGVLKTAQALGDAQALREANRRVIVFDLGQNPATRLKQLVNELD
ncbi:MAG TPA: bifunctional transaldolase/phosoglucose isomerase [Anaerolineae bacterium]|jgi:transaldolase/glucose-6-phosphate isomerase|nr:bifunctional transaldolase/phosoglucose isomerase [Anaerolineae bacterium]